MDKLLAMEVFVHVVDAGGFTRAAQQLQMPKATVSTLLQKLETTLGAKLLNRTTRQISVTADGAAYYERCLRILGEVKDSEEALSTSRSSASGRLRVEVPHGLGTQIIIPALPDFLAQYPQIQLEMGVSDRTVDLIEEGVDCALRGGELADSTLIARRVGVLKFITCASSAYLAQHGMPQHPHDLLKHQCINYFSARSGKIYDWDFARGDEKLQFPSPGRISVNNTDAYMQAGLAGMGILQLPMFMLRPFLTTGQMQLVLPDWESEPIALHIVYPHNRHLSAKVRAFVEWVAALLAGMPELQL
ncbi:MAG: LysR family transcriptional regulator [Burkholderiales bacterium]|nr:LysR family transcriptional regulator [Burkholderiales bacterium]